MAVAKVEEKEDKGEEGGSEDMKGGGGRGGWERPGGQQGRRIGSATRRPRDGRLPAQDAARNENDGRGRPTGKRARPPKDQNSQI